MALVLDGTNKITATELADNAVTTAKIADDAVTAADLASTLDLSSKTLTIPNTASSGIAKAWGKYNGASNTLDDNYGISSVTDNGTGDFTFNLTTAFANANYAVSGAVGNGNNADTTNTCIRTGTRTTSSCRVSINYASAGTNNLYDYNDISIVFFGD